VSRTGPEPYECARFSGCSETLRGFERRRPALDAVLARFMAGTAPRIVSPSSRSPDRVAEPLVQLVEEDREAERQRRLARKPIRMIRGAEFALGRRGGTAASRIFTSGIALASASLASSYRFDSVV